MKRIPLFFSLFLFISIFMIGCEESHIAPEVVEEAALLDPHDPDNDPYFSAIVAGQRARRGIGL